MKRPNSAETASLVYEAFKDKKEKYSKEIISIMNNRYFREFTGNLYLPKKSNEEVNNGVILYDCSNMELDESKESLIKKLQDNYPLVKFVPFGYKTGTQSVFELLKNDYIKMKYGEEGAEKIAEIASQYKNKPRLFSFNSVDKKERRMSASDGYWDFDDGLVVNGNIWSEYDGAHAFGIKKWFYCSLELISKILTSNFPMKKN